MENNISDVRYRNINERLLNLGEEAPPLPIAEFQI